MRASNHAKASLFTLLALLVLPGLGTVAIALAAESTAPPRAWTDIHGRKITAVLIDCDAQSVRLRKPGDATVYTVPLERLSMADREYVRTVGRPKAPDTAPSMSPSAVNPRSVEPPVPSQQGGLQPTDWDKSVRGDIDRATGLRTRDPVSALLLFKGVLDRTKDGPTPTQQAWLTEQIAQLKPTALTTLRQDYQAATAQSNLLDMLIAQVVADKIAKEFLDGKADMTAVKNRVFTEQASPQYVWRVDEAALQDVASPYTEGGSFNRITLTSKKGSHLVRVTARVTNISRGSEKPYTLFAFEPIETAIVPIFQKQDELPSSYRWLDDSFIYLLTPAFDLIPCSHVVEGCTLRTGSLTVSGPDGSGRVIALPQAVKSEASINVDVIFSAPDDLKGFKLYVFGARPVPTANQ